MRVNRTMTEKRVKAFAHQSRVEHEVSDISSNRPQVTMFYDGGCPLCSREVAHYGRLDHEGRIQWLDIHANPGVVESIGVEYTEAMTRLHVRDRAGEIQTGVWAFAAIWDELPYYRWLARTLRFLRLLPALDLAYTRFARWRLRRRGCTAATCPSR